MYLKEIEVSGFKSFAEKLNIKLDNNITCIVGPNGSGKSNIVDAVRWVLGEQSVKSLRGDGNMSDVIFSGSLSRKASSVASVSLIFDNSDNYLNIPFTEVSVKRRVYKTGENEYFLNGEKCRLKDITDLFMDSGIGKESFNIISQGEVMQILSTSAHDRRIIFEEASGVLKYKKRKDEANRKLDRTNNNLDRANDIILELEGQVIPLREQSKKAKEYLENKDMLEKSEIALVAYETNEINEKIKETKTELNNLNEQLIISNNNYNKTDGSLINKKEEVKNIEIELNNLNQKLLVVTREKEELNSEKLLIKERSKYKATDSKVHDNIANLKEQSLNLDNEINKLQKEFEIENINYNEIKNKLKEIEEKVLDSNKTREDNLKEYNYKTKEYLELKNKISVLEDRIEQGGNLPYSVKAVLTNPRLTGIDNVLSNLISTNDKFNTALDVAILTSKNYIVCSDEVAAKEAVNYLKDNKLGRATFLPRNVIKPKYIDLETLDVLKRQMGYIDSLNNVVKCDNKYQNIIDNQLGNVILTTDIDSANKIGRVIKNRYRIVTLDGEIINVGGSITGGSLNKTSSIVTEKLELEKLKEKKKMLKHVIFEIENTLKRIDDDKKEIDKELYQYKSEFVNKEELLKTKIALINERQKSSEFITKELSQLEKLVDSSLSHEEEEIINKHALKVQEEDNLVLEINKLTNVRNKSRLELDEMEAKNKEDNQNIRKLENEIKEKEILLSKMDVKIDNYLQILNEDYSMTFEKAFSEYKLDMDPVEARNKVNMYKANIKRIGMVNLDSIEEYERVNERYEFLTSQRDDLLKAKEDLYEIIAEMDEVMKIEFAKTFELIRVEFKKVFRQLFNGGEADLKLTDPDNILETGVDIIASPAGKKLTTITLLSGGEKTLTAISLLFAILNVRTVPFCLFDEVEAALDEANVDNFGKYLDHYKEKTQFLLITHKKKTMEYAKTLYGITMQESGVSKLVSVKLDGVEV